MGISLEDWRGRLGQNERRRSHPRDRTKGIPKLFDILHWNMLVLIANFIQVIESLQKRFLRKMTTNQLNLFVLQLTLCLSATISQITSNLMHDIETHPGPCMAQVSGLILDLFCFNLEFQGLCPGDGVLGPQTNALHSSTEDPLTRVLRGSTYTFGGVSRYNSSLKKAIDSFIHREYPYLEDVEKQQGLRIVPGLPNADTDITWEELTKHCISERHGGLIQGNFTSISVCVLIDWIQVTLLHKAPIKWIQRRQRPSQNF